MPLQEGYKYDFLSVRIMIGNLPARSYQAVQELIRFGSQSLEVVQPCPIGLVIGAERTSMPDIHCHIIFIYFLIKQKD